MRPVLKSCLVLLSLAFVVSCSDESSYHQFQKPESVSISGATISEETLPNGIRVMAVSIPSSTQPKMSVSVGVGSAHDPKEQPGLAHFVEHMLFLGSKEYPNSLETDNFIESSQGYRNAYTADHFTNYQLTTNYEAFPEAVRRYSRFFVSPLFTESLVQKEKNAIQNEFILRFDAFKGFRAAAVLDGIDSVNTLFNIGNLESLKDTTSEHARAFYEKYYSAKNMVVVISGSQSVKELKELVRAHFADVPARTVTLPEEPKSEKMLNKIVKINSPQANDSLQLNIAIDKTENPRVNDALSVIGTILADESRGSLLSILQDMGYATNRSSALVGSITDSMISVRISLTDLGVKNYTEVIALTKGYIEFLKVAPEPRYVLSELNGLAKADELTADYSKLSVDDFAGIADRYNDGKTVQDIFSTRKQLSYEPAQYKTAQSLLNIKSMTAVLIDNDPAAPDIYSQKFANITFKDSKKYDIKNIDGIDYIVDGYYKFASVLESLDPVSIPTKSNTQFAVPQANPYIPMAFALKTKAELSAVDTISQPNLDVLFNPLSDSTLPETQTSIYLFSSGVNFADKKELAKIILMKNWLLTTLNPDLYPFVLAGAEPMFNVLFENNALRIHLKSWNDTSAQVTRDYIKLIRFSQDEVAFQKYKNVTLISIDQQMRDAQAQIESVQLSMYLEFPTLQENRDVVASITLKDLEDVYNRFFKKYYAQAVISGHYTREDGLAVSEAVRTQWPSEPMTKEDLTKIKKTSSAKTINEVMQVTIDAADSNTAIVSDFYQLGTTSKKEQLMSKMIGEWIGPEFYYELRTQQQLAYSLWAGYSRLGQYYGVLMYLESSSATGVEIETAIRNFITDWAKNKLPLKTQSDVNSFIDRQLEIEKKQAQVLNQDAAIEKLLDLGWVYSEEKDSTTISISEVIEFANQKLINNPAGLMIKVKSNAEKEQAPPEQKLGPM